jgi:hypothetical protein
MSTFTFLEFRRRTEDLDGQSRLAVFGELPEPLQRQAWADLREHFDHVADLDFRDWCGDDR